VQKLFALYNFEFVTDQCVLCGKKTELVTYSLPAGGLICHNCCSPAQRQSIDTKTTQALFALFHSDLPTIVKIFNDRMCRKLIQMLLTTLNYHLGSHFHL
jgi:recombinational DNA repair protein (RecF pathway)